VATRSSFDQCLTNDAIEALSGVQTPPDRESTQSTVSSMILPVCERVTVLLVIDELSEVRNQCTSVARCR
jgi:hypothetical protein